MCLRPWRTKTETTERPPRADSEHTLERFLLDQVEAAVVATDPAGKVTYWNRHAEELFQYPQQEALGRSLLELIVDPADQDAVLGILEVLGTGESWHGEVAARTRRGTSLPTRLRGSPTYHPDGRFAGMAGVFVDVSEQKRSVRRLAVGYAVTRVLAEAETLAEATPRILEAVAETLEWEVGAIWGVDRAAGLLRCVATWQAPMVKVEEFDALTQNTTFPPGLGLPGRVWESGEPAWIQDVAGDDNFPRAGVAAQEGLHSGFAFPITIGREVLGVIEFFSGDVHQPDHELVDLMSAIGSQIGQFIERKDAEDAVREEIERSRDQMSFLAEASSVLASSLDYRKTLNKVARLAVPRLADWCSVDVLEDDEIRPVAVAHADPTMVEKARELRTRWPADPETDRGTTRVIQTGRPEIYSDITDDVLAQVARDPEHLEVLKSLEMRSAMVVPLRARGRTFGAITFVAAESGRRYGLEDLPLAEELASRAAQAVDNARLYQERAHVARALQQSLLPQRLPQIEWAEVAARYNAAGQGEVGGDFYDVFEASDGAWFAVIGDVQGKGPEAAAVTGLARYTVRAAAAAERNPSRILRTLNTAILKEHTDRFATAALARLQLMNGNAQLAISCGGHPVPLILRASGEVEAPDCLGHLVGVFPDPELKDYLTELAPGDALVFYTDGVIEERAGDLVFGEHRLEAALRESAGLDAEAIAAKIEEAVLSFREEEARDDMAILVLRYRPDGLAQTVGGV